MIQFILQITIALLYYLDGEIKHCIAIIDIESQKVMTTITMDTNIYGMAVRGRTIYYCTTDKGLKMLNLSDRSVSDIISSDMSYVVIYMVQYNGNSKINVFY